MPAPPLPTRTSSKLVSQSGLKMWKFYSTDFTTFIFQSLKRSSKMSSNHSNNSGGVYANLSLNRTSLMSTGSSEESSGSSGLQDEVLSPTLASDQAMFAWPNYSVSPCPSSQNAEQEHRSVSQIGEPPDSASETSSDAYIKMHPKVTSEATYMNVIYNGKLLYSVKIQEKKSVT